ncbi:LysM domain-containing protein, partial [Vibrio sp. 10N.222.49.E5]|uniref:LysM peptidoglycan-binding domain-containing protein n=1 Tax=Vibrio sp. 10N.222.49.E5 TaxID=3229617 RepID=UPI00354CB0FC
FAYRFPSSRLVVAEDTQIVEPPVIIPPVTVPPVPICKMVKRYYTLVEGDYLIKVAKAHDMYLEQLIDLNPQFHSRELDLVYPNEVVNLLPLQVCK